MGAMYDAMLNTLGSVTDYNDAMALKCGATAPVTALPDGWVGANHQSAVCVNASPTATNDGYSCECPEGSELAADGSACEDIKECASGAHTCGNQQCIDYCMHGSSDGVTGPATYLADGTTCSADGTTYIAPADCTNSVECDKTTVALNPSNVYCGSNSCACTAGGECALACYDA